MNNKAIVFSLLICLMFTAMSNAMFDTLALLEQYADSLPEYVDTENDNWISPSFVKFHKSRTPGAVKRFLQRVGLFQKSWDPIEFKKMVQQVTKDRELSGHIGDFFLSYAPKKGDQFYIWTDIFGAYHSLIRDLKELQRQGVIDDALKVTKDNCWLIFNGNAIDHSPYSVDTLTLLVQLMERNPKNVIYLRGDHESNQVWHSFSLAKELKTRADYISSKLIPLNTELTKFFNTLPLGLYLTDVKKEEIDLALITNNKIMRRGINENKYASVFEEFADSSGFAIHKLQMRAELSKKKADLKVIITGEDRSVSYQKTKGLLRETALKKETVWTIFSSPTSRNRRLYEFFYDALALLSIPNGISSWTIQLINQDVRALQGFETGKKLSLIPPRPERIKMMEAKKQAKSASPPVEKKTSPPVEKKKGAEPTIAPASDQEMEEGVAVISELEIASIIDITKGTKLLGRALKAGMEIRLKKAEEDGYGVPKVFFVDDQYTPTKTRKEVERLLADGINTILCPEGSPTLASYLDLVKQGRVSVFFPATGAPIARKKELTTLINFRPSYKTEGELLTRYALDNFKSKKGFMLYQKDAYGKGLLEGARDVLKERGVTNWTASFYERNEVNFKEQVQQAVKEEPDVILFFSTTFAAQEFIRQIGVENLLFKKLLGSSDFGEDQFVTFSKDKGITIIYPNVVPDPLTSTLPIVEEFRQIAKQNNISLDTFSLEGYIATDLLLYAIDQIRPPYSRFTIMKALEQIKNKDYKGLKLNFDPENRTLSHTFWLNENKGEWKEITIAQSKPTSSNTEQKADERYSPA